MGEQQGDSFFIGAPCEPYLANNKSAGPVRSYYTNLPACAAWLSPRAVQRKRRVPNEAANSPVLTACRLTRAVGDRPLVDAISLEVRRGEVLVVTGPSGSGKTSFLRLLNRLDEPTGGTVLLEGTDYRNIPPPELRRRVGMVMQTAFLFPAPWPTTSRYGPRQHGEELSDTFVDELLEKVDLQGFASRPAANLSGGEAQRVALARVIANSPAVFAAGRADIGPRRSRQGPGQTSYLQIVKSTRLTCIAVTHDLALAERMADRVMVLRAGRVERVGPKEEVLKC